MASQNAPIYHLHIGVGDRNCHSPRPPLAVAGACTHSSEVETHTDLDLSFFIIELNPIPAGPVTFIVPKTHTHTKRAKI